MPISSVLPLLHHLVQLACTLLSFLITAVRYLRLCLRPSTALAAENLFLRKQLALYQERHVKPHRATEATRLALVWLGRPPIPTALQALICRMAQDNPTWGEERIANELLLKLGLQVSPRTVRKYMPKSRDRGRHTPVPSQRWVTFVRNHAQAIVACDFCVVVTATFRLLYVFVLMEHATRRILHCNMTAYPTAQWTLQQLREAIPADHSYRFLIHDRDSIFSAQLDRNIQHLGLRVLQTPPQHPQANAFCERLIGTLRQECLDFLIPLSANHLRRILTQWIPHYNAGRPHMSLGPASPNRLRICPCQCSCAGTGFQITCES